MWVCVRVCSLLLFILIYMCECVTVCVCMCVLLLFILNLCGCVCVCVVYYCLFLYIIYIVAVHYRCNSLIPQYRRPLGSMALMPWKYRYDVRLIGRESYQSLLCRAIKELCDLMLFAIYTHSSDQKP